MLPSNSSRILATPSSFAKTNFLYVQEVGSLQSLSPHVSRRDNLESFLFFAVTKGKGTLSYRGQTFSLTAGDCVLLDCLKEYAHESSVDEPWELSWVHFHGKQAPTLYRHFGELGGNFLFHPNDLSIFLDTLDILFETQKNPGNSSEFLSHRYLTDLIALCINEIGNAGGSSISEKIHDIQTFLDIHFAEKISLDSLAEQYYVSKFHLAREFKKTTGSTIGNYLTAKRISHAKKQLRFTNLTLDTIACECGFFDTSHFVKVFKNAEGMTPREYRNRW
ncbi:MAG: helix-turn-helix domain-containing protein [Lachnospiraceae bacterium]|nr:helix-turn-helix domain-containing protein [Lachnospiraceae bacterium]